MFLFILIFSAVLDTEWQKIMDGFLFSNVMLLIPPDLAHKY